jgi:hypothetical protein
MPLTTRYGFADAPTSAILGNSSLGWTTLAALLGIGGTALTVASAAGFPSAVEFDILVGLRDGVTGIWSNAELLHVTVTAGVNWTVSAAVLAHALGESVGAVLTTAGLQNAPGAETDSGDLQYLNASGRMARLAVGGANTVLRSDSTVPNWGQVSTAFFASANVSQWTNDAGYATATSATAFSNKTGNISQWTNDSGYLTSASGVTSITGTANQVIASAPTGAVTLSLPQSIATTSTPQFLRLGLNQAADATASLAATQSGLINVSTDGVILANETAATAGVPLQRSPRLRLRAHVWGVSDNSSDWAIESIPVSVATPRGLLSFTHSLAGGGYAAGLTIDTGVGLAIAGGIKIGVVTAINTVDVGNTGLYVFGARSVFASSADGLVTLSNAAKTDFSRLLFGGTTASFPAIKRNAAALNFRVGDDTADAAITAAAATFSGKVSVTSANATGTTTAAGTAHNENALTAGTGVYLASSTLTSGLLMDLQVSGTAAAASQTALNILTAGATATNAITTYGAQISNTHTNVTSGTNVALYLNASGATTANYGLIVNAGMVGILTTAPLNAFEIAGNGVLRLRGGAAPDFATTGAGFESTYNTVDTTVSATAGVSLFQSYSRDATGWRDLWIRSLNTRFDTGGNPALYLKVNAGDYGSVGVGSVTAPTARLHLMAGGAAANTAPLKFTAGTNLTTPEFGALSCTDDGTTGHLYVTLRVATVVTRIQVA